MSSSSVALCRDRMYVTRHVTDLPRRCCVGDTDLTVEYARLDEHDRCRQVACYSANGAENVGLGQLENDRDFQILLQCSEIFVARSRHTGRAEAFIAIQPCLLAR